MNLNSASRVNPALFMNTDPCIAGPPNLKIDAGIEKEHTVLAGFDSEFKTTNYGITTCPRKEYEIVTGLRPCPESETKDKHGRPVRTLRTIDALKVLEISQKAKLTDAEILAVVSGQGG